MFIFAVGTSREALSRKGHHLLATSHGPLDVLGAIGVDDDYSELNGHTENVEISNGVIVKILDLSTLIAVKEKTARMKDNYLLEILREMQSLQSDWVFENMARSEGYTWVLENSY